MTEPIFLGLDGEMTGSDPPPKHQLIQIGIAMMNRDHYVSDIGQVFFNFSEEARKVNGFTDERVRAARLPNVVDNELYAWLVARGAKPKSLVPVGLNCGSFDMVFVRYYLPRTASLFSYRSVDLNSTIFSIARATGRNWKAIKTEAKAFAANPKPHDAGADAQEALAMWDYLIRLIIRGARE